MSSADQTTPNSGQFKSTALPTQEMSWKWVRQLFKVSSTTNEVAQDTSAELDYLQDSQLRRLDVLSAQAPYIDRFHEYQPKISDVKPFPLGIGIPDLRRLDGGWVYNNFNSFR